MTQVKLLEMAIMYEMKDTVDGINDTLNTAEGKNDELKIIAIETTKNIKQIKKRNVKSEENISELWNNFM